MQLFNLNTSSGTNVLEDVRQAMSAVSVAVTTTASIVLQANPNRTRYSIHNTGISNVLVREGVAPVSGAAPVYNVLIPPGFMWVDNMPDARFSGAIHAISVTGSNNLIVSEAAF